MSNGYDVVSVVYALEDIIARHSSWEKMIGTLNELSPVCFVCEYAPQKLTSTVLYPSQMYPEISVRVFFCRILKCLALVVDRVLWHCWWEMNFVSSGDWQLYPVKTSEVRAPVMRAKTDMIVQEIAMADWDWTYRHSYWDMFSECLLFCITHIIGADYCENKWMISDTWYFQSTDMMLNKVPAHPPPLDPYAELSWGNCQWFPNVWVCLNTSNMLGQAN